MSRLGLLASHAVYRALWSARTISFLGDTLATVALVLYVSQIEGDATAVGFLLLAQSLPRLLGPFAGTLVDRTDQRRLMLICEVAQALLMGTIALFLPPFPILLGLVALAAFFATLFSPAGRSALPTLVAPDDVPAANALLGSGLNLSLALGPVLGGVLIVVIGVQGVLLFNAVSFILSALLLRQLPPLPPVPSTEERTGVLKSTWEGVTYLAQQPTARAVALGLFLVVTFAALDNVALVFLAQESLGTDAAGFGLLSSAYGVGMILFPLLLLRWSGRFAPSMMLLFSILLMGAGTLLTGLAPTVALALAAQLLAGSGNGLENVSNDTLIQRTVPRHMLGRLFGLIYSGAALAANLAYAAGGPLLELTSPRMVFLISGSGVLLTLVVVWMLLPRSSEQPEEIPVLAGA
ncbi:MAG: MFS transporter [Ardenticatenales bacterium]|nr:MFS transporter [Ardenticatenales bacterium]